MLEDSNRIRHFPLNAQGETHFWPIDEGVFSVVVCFQSGSRTSRLADHILILCLKMSQPETPSTAQIERDHSETEQRRQKLLIDRQQVHELLVQMPASSVYEFFVSSASVRDCSV